jgi:hypothetical protein
MWPPAESVKSAIMSGPPAPRPKTREEMAQELKALRVSIIGSTCIHVDKRKRCGKAIFVYRGFPSQLCEEHTTKMTHKEMGTAKPLEMPHSARELNLILKKLCLYCGCRLREEKVLKGGPSQGCCRQHNTNLGHIRMLSNDPRGPSRGFPMYLNDAHELLMKLEIEPLTSEPESVKKGTTMVPVEISTPKTCTAATTSQVAAAKAPAETSTVKEVSTSQKDSISSPVPTAPSGGECRTILMGNDTMRNSNEKHEVWGSFNGFIAGLGWYLDNPHVSSIFCETTKRDEYGKASVTLTFTWLNGIAHDSPKGSKDSRRITVSEADSE